MAWFKLLLLLGLMYCHTALVRRCLLARPTRLFTSAVKGAANDEYLQSDMDGAEYSGQSSISWYPGHIAKAERELADYLKKVDVVIEVRDARIPLSTTHPMVPEWVGSKPLIIAIARLDQISKQALLDWKEYYARNPAHPERPDAKVYFVDGKLGTGVLALKREALKAGISVNEKRERRGIQPRAVRAAVIGFPNVGKSALINRLLGRKMATSRNLPGVTKSLRWVRLGGDAGASASTLEVLDSPGIIPARQFDQVSALKLAICNDIGEASYDRVVVATALCNQLISLHKANPKYVNMGHIIERYKFPFNEMNGEEILYQVAQNVYRGNTISAADKILGDFRKGLLKFASLEAADLVSNEESDREGSDNSGSADNSARDRVGKTESSKVFHSLDIGKGSYEGW